MSITLYVRSADELEVEGVRYRCAVGKAGFVAEDDKLEGDNKTPVGRYVMRECWYRADKIAKPETALSLKEISQDDGWCDAPEHEHYNRHVSLPFNASHETLWRNDDAYDLIVPLGYNDDPIVPGRGSAIFMHVAQPDFRGTEGCVALAKEDLLALLKRVDALSCVEIDV